ncbi:MAG: hypothetical protein MRK01_06440 [Candidatus Scalindua sp.]|nr:hypothetical protein [Candidatus Scalindua sp.]
MKKKSAEQRQQEIKHQMRISAGLIKDVSPDVKEIVFEFKLKDPDGSIISPNYKPSYSSYKRLPQDSAFFQFECNNHECVNGGFGLTKEIKNMTHVHKLNSFGTLICQGWQDSERVDQHSCLNELTYSVRIVYWEKSQDRY